LRKLHIKNPARLFLKKGRGTRGTGRVGDGGIGRWSDGAMEWNDGVMQGWRDGAMTCPVLCIAAPSLKFHIHQAGLIGRWT